MEATKVAIVLVLLLLVISVAGIMMVDNNSESSNFNLGATIQQGIKIQRPTVTGQSINIVRPTLENGGVVNE